MKGGNCTQTLPPRTQSTEAFVTCNGILDAARKKTGGRLGRSFVGFLLYLIQGVLKNLDPNQLQELQWLVHVLCMYCC